jgi:hypothetical protein
MLQILKAEGAPPLRLTDLREAVLRWEAFCFPKKMCEKTWRLQRSALPFVKDKKGSGCDEREARAVVPFEFLA